MARKQLADGYHLSLSLGKALWDDLLHAALPIKVKDGEFDLGRMVYRGVKQLGVRERVTALLEDRQPPAVVDRARQRAAALWRDRREQVYRTLDGLVHVEGTWRLELDREGTEFHYSTQKFGVDAHLKAVADGRARFLGGNLEFPFTLEKRLGAAINLADIRYEKDIEAIVGDIADPMIDFGDHVVLRLLNEASGFLLENQLTRFSPVPILKKEQVESLVAPAGGPLKLQMGVEDIAIEVTDNDLTLRVRFGFTQKQLTDEAAAGA